MAQLVPRIIDSTCFTIGQASIAIDHAPTEPPIDIPAAYQPFITTAAPDIRIGLKLGQPRLEGLKVVFESPPIWSLYSGKGLRVFSIFNQMPERSHSFCLTSGITHPVIQFSPEFRRPFDPFCGPALELLTVVQLAVGSGCLLHGCGIQLSNRGILFAGQSGAGKSTMLKLWAEESDALILSDDRTIAKYLGSELRIYGTPWHGKARGGLPRSANLAAIFFLKHGRANSMRRLRNADIVRKLLTCSFPPLWDAAGMSATLDFFNSVGKEIPCYELEFVPDDSIVKFIRQWSNGLPDA